MEEPQQQQEAAAPLEVMGPDLTSVMGWALLLKISRHMDTAGRSNWRLVSKAARQAVYDSTTALAPCRDNNCHTSTTALLPQLLARCSGLRQLSCRCLPNFDSIAGLLQLPPHLEDLSFSHTDVMDLSFIAQCTSLRRLAADNCSSRPGLNPTQLAAVLQQLPGLTVLVFTSGMLHVDAARDVAAALPHLTALQELGISWLNPDAAAALLPAVPHLSGLQRLTLDCGDLQQACSGLQSLPAVLPAALQLPCLRHLSLHSIKLQADGALSLAPAVGKLTRLDSLLLGGNRLGDKGISALAPAIQQLTGLTSLGMGNTGFGQAGAHALAPALHHLTGLQTLELFENNLGPQGAALLAPALQELTGLRDLLLSDTGLGAEGAAALAPALQRLTLLQHLDMGHNHLRPEGLHALLPGIQQLVGLRTLNLQGNALDKDSDRHREGLLEFAAGIRRLTRLQCLTLSTGRMRARFALALAYFIQSSSRGCTVH